MRLHYTAGRSAARFRPNTFRTTPLMQIRWTPLRFISSEECHLWLQALKDYATSRYSMLLTKASRPAKESLFEMVTEDLDRIGSHSLDNREHIARVHWRSLRGKDLDDLAFLWRLKFILHLHGLDHDYTCAVFHLDTGLSDHANNFSRHGSHDLLRAILRARASTATAPRARISHLN